jgi:hypothetical protein
MRLPHVERLDLPRGSLTHLRVDGAIPPSVIAHYAKQGYNFSAIGRGFGVTRERIRQIAAGVGLSLEPMRVKRDLDLGFRALLGASPRATSVIMAAGFTVEPILQYHRTAGRGVRRMRMAWKDLIGTTEGYVFSVHECHTPAKPAETYYRFAFYQRKPAASVHPTHHLCLAPEGRVYVVPEADLFPPGAPAETQRIARVDGHPMGSHPQGRPTGKLDLFPYRDAWPARRYTATERILAQQALLRQGLERLSSKNGTEAAAHG